MKFPPELSTTKKHENAKTRQHIWKKHVVCNGPKFKQQHKLLHSSGDWLDLAVDELENNFFEWQLCHTFSEGIHEFCFFLP